jgi:hypothetical protein
VTDRLKVTDCLRVRQAAATVEARLWQGDNDPTVNDNMTTHSSTLAPLFTCGASTGQVHSRSQKNKECCSTCCSWQPALLLPPGPLWAPPRVEEEQNNNKSIQQLSHAQQDFHSRLHLSTCLSCRHKLPQHDDDSAKMFKALLRVEQRVSGSLSSTVDGVGKWGCATLAEGSGALSKL